MTPTTTTAQHRFDHDTDRCTCGGQWVWFERDDRGGEYGYGCEVGGVVLTADGLPVDGFGRPIAEEL